MMELRCGCEASGSSGRHVLEPCARHLEWMEALVLGEREECAKIADARARQCLPEEDAAEAVAMVAVKIRARR